MMTITVYRFVARCIHDNCDVKHNQLVLASFIHNPNNKGGNVRCLGDVSERDRGKTNEAMQRAQTITLTHSETEDMAREIMLYGKLEEGSEFGEYMRHNIRRKIHHLARKYIQGVPKFEV